MWHSSCHRNVTVPLRRFSFHDEHVVSRCLFLAELSHACAAVIQRSREVGEGSQGVEGGESQEAFKEPPDVAHLYY